jgi:hypothetical protein
VWDTALCQGNSDGGGDALALRFDPKCLLQLVPFNVSLYVFLTLRCWSSLYGSLYVSFPYVCPFLYVSLCVSMCVCTLAYTIAY